jgi:hypothetical protein
VCVPFANQGRRASGRDRGWGASGRESRGPRAAAGRGRHAAAALRAASREGRGGGGGEAASREGGGGRAAAAIRIAGAAGGEGGSSLGHRSPRVGLRIVSFGAVSVFTHVTACQLADGLTPPSVSQASTALLPPQPLGIATRLGRPLPGQDFHLLEQRTFSRRTWTSTGSASPERKVWREQLRLTQ